MLQILIRLWKQPYSQTKLAKMIGKSDQNLSSLLKHYKREGGFFSFNIDRQLVFSYTFLEELFKALKLDEAECSELMEFLEKNRARIAETLKENEKKLLKYTTEVYEKKGFLTEEELLTFLLLPIIESYHDESPSLITLHRKITHMGMLNLLLSGLQMSAYLAGQEEVDDLELFTEEEVEFFLKQLEIFSQSDLGMLVNSKITKKGKRLEGHYEKGKVIYEIIPN